MVQHQKALGPGIAAVFAGKTRFAGMPVSVSTPPTGAGGTPWLLALCLGLSLVAAGCKTATTQKNTAAPGETLLRTPSYRNYSLSSETRDRILALDPERVTETDIRNVLADAPAPRLITIHGGLLPMEGSLASFAQFLVGMGYPRASIENPRDGSVAFGYYVSSEKLSGVLAWWYEREGLRPVMIGHSQGGIQVVKVLHRLSGDSRKKIPVWNPVTWASENRYEFADPVTGRLTPVVSLRIPYASAVVAGGLGRALPNHWEMIGRLREIPDSAEEFTGFQKGMDALGGDFLGYGPANNYKATGLACVRNVRLPAGYGHTNIPRTSHLLKSQQIRDWINNYRPSGDPVETPELNVTFDSDSSHILWAADVWFSLKKHWVLELQRLLRAHPSNV
jgi:hypothetical protein